MSINHLILSPINGKIIKWIVNNNTLIKKDENIINILTELNEIYILKSNFNGILKRKINKEGVNININDVLGEVFECSHPAIYKNLCVSCGMKIKQTNTNSSSLPSSSSSSSLPSNSLSSLSTLSTLSRGSLPSTSSSSLSSISSLMNIGSSNNNNNNNINNNNRNNNSKMTLHGSKLTLAGGQTIRLSELEAKQTQQNKITAMKKNKKLALILDLDSTLVHATPFQSYPEEVFKATRMIQIEENGFILR